MPSSLPGRSSLMTLPSASLNVMRRSGRSSTSAVMLEVFTDDDRIGGVHAELRESRAARP